MIRRLFAIASAVSLLLCIVSIGLWARSFWVADSVCHVSHIHHADDDIKWIKGESKTELTSERGYLVLMRYRHQPRKFGMEPLYDKREGLGRRVRAPHAVRMPAMLQGAIGMRWTHWEHAFTAFSWVTWSNDRDEDLYVHVPWLYIVMLLLLCPVAQIAAIVRRRRRLARRGGFCEICGYNLTGNTSGVCPECGTPVPGKSGATA
jgi:hypothetical protein